MSTISKKIKSALKKNVVEFRYIKNDGTIRFARGTTNPEIINTLYEYKGGSGPEKYGYVNYWDVDTGGWRCFDERRLVNIVRVED